MGRRKVSRKQEMKGEAGDSITSAFGARSGTVLCPWNEESSKGQSPLAECVCECVCMHTCVRVRVCSHECMRMGVCVGDVESGEVLSALILP